MDKCELVTVIVLSYNSEEFIIETINSIENQTYKNLEIIVCDDCSSDNTLQVLESYIQEKNLKIKILRSEKNGGIPKNCNKGIKFATSKYIKLIAADDILFENCIEENIKFMKENNNLFQFSDFSKFYVENKRNIVLENQKNMFWEKVNNSSTEDQLYHLMYENYILAPTAFFNKIVFDKYGLFNEKIKLMEDYPMWIKLLENGVQVKYLDKKLVNYRISNNSLAGGEMSEIFKNEYLKYIKFELIPKIKKKKFICPLIKNKSEIEFLLNGKGCKFWGLRALDYICIKRNIKKLFRGR